MTGAFEYFKKGFESIKMKDFKNLILTLVIVNIVSGILSVFIPIIPTLVAGFFTSFYVWEIILKNSNIRTRKLGEFEFKNLIPYFKYVIAKSILTLINWIDKKILAIQLILYLLIFMFAFSVNVIGTIIIILIIFLIYLYNHLRFYFALPIRLLESDGTIDSFKKSWEMTEGKAGTLFLIYVLYSIFYIIMLLLVLLPIIVFLTLSNLNIEGMISQLSFIIIAILIMLATLTLFLILASFIPIFEAYIFAKYYIDIKKEEKAD